MKATDAIVYVAVTAGTVTLLGLLGLGIYSCDARETECRRAVLTECIEAGRQECALMSARVCGTTNSHQ